MVGALADAALIVDLQDQARPSWQIGHGGEKRVPVHGPLAGMPVPVGVAIGILQVHMFEHRARSADIGIHWRRPGRHMGVKRMSGIERNPQPRASQRLRQMNAGARVAVLDILDHQRHAGILGARDHRVQNEAGPFDLDMGGGGVGCVVMIVPCGIGRMDHHLIGAQFRADIQRAQHPRPDHLGDLRIGAVDG